MILRILSNIRNYWCTTFGVYACRRFRFAGPGGSTKGRPPSKRCFRPALFNFLFCQSLLIIIPSGKMTGFPDVNLFFPSSSGKLPWFPDGFSFSPIPSGITSEIPDGNRNSEVPSGKTLHFPDDNYLILGQGWQEEIFQTQQKRNEKRFPQILSEIRQNSGKSDEKCGER